MRGRLDFEMTWAASRRSSGLGTILEMRAGFRNCTSSPFYPGFGRHLDQYGTRSAAAQLPERFEHSARNFIGPGSLLLPLGDGAHRAGLVCNFMHSADVFADCGARDLTCYEEHGRGAGVGVGQAGSGVVETHARDHQRDARLA